MTCPNLSLQLTQLEHVLKRPDTYIGSVEKTDVKMWVYDSEKEHMVFRNVSMVPGLYKIFDEILVNAADNKIRDSNMDTLRVTVDKVENTVSVYNNGRGIPIEIHSVSSASLLAAQVVNVRAERRSLCSRIDFWPSSHFKQLRR